MNTMSIKLLTNSQQRMCITSEGLQVRRVVMRDDARDMYLEDLYHLGYYDLDITLWSFVRECVTIKYLMSVFFTEKAYRDEYSGDIQLKKVLFKKLDRDQKKGLRDNLSDQFIKYLREQDCGELEKVRGTV